MAFLPPASDHKAYFSSVFYFRLTFRIVLHLNESFTHTWTQDIPVS